MGTRAVITFIETYDGEAVDRFHVYQHNDGYPEDVIENLKNIQKTWPWPRWEADEAAAAYVATYKIGPGDIRLSSGPDAHGDLAYSYEVRNTGDQLEVLVRSGGTGTEIAVETIVPKTA